MPNRPNCRLQSFLGITDLHGTHIKCINPKDNGIAIGLPLPRCDRATLVCVSLARVSRTSKYSGNYISPETHAAERENGHCAPHYSLSSSCGDVSIRRPPARHVCKINTRRCSILVDWNLRSCAVCGVWPASLCARHPTHGYCTPRQM